MPSMICVIEEYIGPLDAALGDVVGNFRTDYPSHSRHSIFASVPVEIDGSKGKGVLFLVQDETYTRVNFGP